MCGIAGYSISPRKANHLKVDNFLDMVQAMTDTNIHRGGDAYGYMMGFHKPVNDKNHRFFSMRKPGKGFDMAERVEANVYAEGNLQIAPITLGIHTRGKSHSFSETVPDNNHPVLYGKVSVIHNGMIRNHHKLKNELRPLVEDVHGSVPAGIVDSVAIPMLLCNYSDPEKEFTEIGEALTRLVGGFAFGAMWHGKPDDILLVSGPEYPLVMWFEDDAIFYGSEEQCLSTSCGLLRNFEFKSKPVKFEPGVYMLLRKGKIVKRGTYDVEQEELDKLQPKKSAGLLTNVFERWNEDTKAWVRISRAKMGVTNKAHDPAKTAWYSSVDHTDLDDPPMLMFEKGKGIVNAKQWRSIIRAGVGKANSSNSGPKVHDGDSLDALVKWKECFEVVMNADRIYILQDPVATSQHTLNFLLYAFFDTKVEVVVNDLSKIVSINNWSQGLDIPTYKTTWELRQEEAKEKEDPSIKEKIALYQPSSDDSEEDFKLWLKRNTLASTDEMLPGEKVKGVMDDSKSSGTHSTPITVGSEVMDLKRDGGKLLVKNFKPNLYMTDWADLESWMSPIAYDSAMEALQSLTFVNTAYGITIPLMWDEKCTVHKQQLAKHPQPEMCLTLLAGAIATVTWFEDFDTWIHVFGGEFEWAAMEGTEEQNLCPHKVWGGQQYDVYQAFGTYVDLLTSEQCEDCDIERLVVKYPVIVENFIEFAKGNWPAFQAKMSTGHYL